MYINAGSSYLRYDPTGRKRKKKKPKGEVYQKMTKRFVEMTYKTTFQQQRAMNSKNIESVQTIAHNCDKINRQYYTGDMVIGIATMHKSNAVPITNVEHAKDIARMRR